MVPNSVDFGSLWIRLQFASTEIHDSAVKAHQHGQQEHKNVRLLCILDIELVLHTVSHVYIYIYI